MAQLRDHYDEFLKLDTAVLIVGPERPKAFESYWKENDLPFVGLPDPDHKVLKLYGQEVKIFKFGRMPAMAVIDKSGQVRFVHYGQSMSDIPAAEEVLELLSELNQGLSK